MFTPTPERTTAKLASAGYLGRPKFTPHTYTRTELVVFPPWRDGAPTTYGYAFIFACDETGAERRFGLERTSGLEAEA